MKNGTGIGCSRFCLRNNAIVVDYEEVHFLGEFQWYHTQEQHFWYRFETYKDFENHRHNFHEVLYGGNRQNWSR